MHAFTTIADHCRNRLSTQFPDEDFIAYAKQFLPSGVELHSFHHWENALAAAHRSLVGKQVHEAERLVKTEAARVLQRPSILEHFEAREAARVKLEEAQAEHNRVAQAEATEKMYAQMAKKNAEQKAAVAAKWATDWDSQILSNEAEVERLYSNPGDMSVHDRSHLNYAFSEIQRLEVLKRIAARRKA